MDLIDTIRDWAWLLTALGPILLTIGMLYLRNQFPTKAEAAAGQSDLFKRMTEDGTALRASMADLAAQMESRRGDTDRRLAHLEAVTGHLPSRGDIAGLERRLGEVERQGAVTAETVRGIDRMVSKVDHTLEIIVQNQIAEKRNDR